MFEALDNFLLAGVGALTMSREKAKKIFDEYVERGKAERGSESGFVKELMTSAEKTRKELEDLVAKQVKEAIVRLNLPTREDLARVEAKLDELLSRGK